MATDRRARLHEALAEVTSGAGVVGAVLVTRDGFCVAKRSARLANAETFAAMTATLLAAAEAAAEEFGPGEGPTIVVRTKGLSILVQGATAELFLVAVAEPSADLGAVELRTAATAAAIAKLVAG